MHCAIGANSVFFDYFHKKTGKKGIRRLLAGMHRIMSHSSAAKKILKLRLIRPINRGGSLQTPLRESQKAIADKAIFLKMAIDSKRQFYYRPPRATPPSSTVPKSQNGHEEYENGVAPTANPLLGFPGLLAGRIRPA
ncbi:MAG: hypothetical protein EBS01_06895 [Verrucomicrobia bacterium]|nr:hypothetical protein [Verrucomicrobiota bacterium]